MKKIILISALTAVSIAVSGCGWLGGDKGMFRDRGDDYRRARVEKPLQIPAELGQYEGEQDFAIPEIARSAPLAGVFEAPRPAPLDGDPNAEQVRIRALDGTSWVLVEASPGEVWPRVRQFLNTNQLYVTRADATDRCDRDGLAAAESRRCGARALPFPHRAGRAARFVRGLRTAEPPRMRAITGPLHRAIPRAKAR